MKVQGRLMQARFIEIFQVYEKKKVGYFPNRPRASWYLSSSFYNRACPIAHGRTSAYEYVNRIFKTENGN